MTLGVLANLSLLGFFKYYGWFSEELNALLTSLEVGRELPLLEIVLPIGISFYTFQGISYIVDLYRGDLDRPRPLIDVMFFISFFPHLVAGPIVRAASFLPQLERPPDPNRVFVGLGVMLILWGVFKKAVVANWLAVEPGRQGLLRSGRLRRHRSARRHLRLRRADLLRLQRLQRHRHRRGGAARLSLPAQLQPALSGRDARRLLAPLAHVAVELAARLSLHPARRQPARPACRTYLNLLLTMVLGGIWHGAAWKFVIWGALHGGMLALERMFSGGGSGRSRLEDGARPLWRRALAVLLVFHFVCLCWIFFRADSATRAGDVLAGLANWSQPATLLTPFLGSPDRVRAR